MFAGVVANAANQLGKWQILSDYGTGFIILPASHQLHISLNVQAQRTGRGTRGAIDPNIVEYARLRTLSTKNTFRLVHDEVVGQRLKKIAGAHAVSSILMTGTYETRISSKESPWVSTMCFSHWASSLTG